MTAFNIGSQKQPIFGKYGAGFLGSSPGRAEQRRGKYGNTIVNKMRKRKRIDRDYSLARRDQEASDSDSESDAEDTKSRTRSKHSKGEANPHWLGSIMSGLASHPTLPSVLSYYVQLALNSFIVGAFIYAAWTFWTAIKADVDTASFEAQTAAAIEIANCRKQYIENGCGLAGQPPLLEPTCRNLDLCMSRDADSVARARISAHTFAQIFNSFVEPISYKAMVQKILSTMLL